MDRSSTEKLSRLEIEAAAGTTGESSQSYKNLRAGRREYIQRHDKDLLSKEASNCRSKEDSSLKGKGGKTS